MDDIWSVLGYTGKCGDDGFPIPGELVKIQRVKRNMSQEQLANELGCSRTMVARMENENLGLNDITTRRHLSKILGITPVMLGLILHEDIHGKKPTLLYDTAILRKSLVLHREVYFSGGDIGGIQEVDTMVQHIFGISKSLEHKNKEVLEILCHYGQLGIDIGREEQNYKAVDRYGNWAVSIARKLYDQSLLASTLLRYTAAMYEKDDFVRAKQYADEAMAQTRIPAKLYGGVILEASRVYTRLGEQNTMKLLEKANNTARRSTDDEDIGFVKLTAGFCHLRIAKAHFDANDYTKALEELDLAEEQTTPNLVRRRCAIQVLQAKTLMHQENYDDATMCANTALVLANTIRSTAHFAYVTAIYNKLKETSFGTSREVVKLGKALTKVVGTKKLLLPV